MFCLFDPVICDLGRIAVVDPRGPNAIWEVEYAFDRQQGK